jgi:hypothetical protein
MSATDIASLPLKRLDKAVNGLRDLGLLPVKANEAPIVALINQISDLDEEKALPAHSATRRCSMRWSASRSPR